MYKVRVGNDINIQWRIFRNDSPEDFAGKTLRLLMRGTSQTIEVRDYVLEGNVIKWEYKGKDQRGPSTFTFTLIENEGKDDMFTVDKCDVLRLVSCSCQADDDDGRFDMFIDTDIVLPSNGVDGKTPVLESGETQTLEPGSEATSEIVPNGEDEAGNPRYKVNLGIPAGEPFTYGDFTPEQIEGLKKPALDAAAVAEAAADAATEAAAGADKAAETAAEAATFATEAAGAAGQAAVDAGLAKTAAEEAAVRATEAAEAAGSAAEEANAAAEAASQTNTEVSTAEQGRVTAEEQRAAAEQTRQAEFSQLKQEAQTATQEANAAAQAANQAVESIEESLSAKQDKTDESLQTTDKTVTGAINELLEQLSGIIRDFGQYGGVTETPMTVGTSGKYVGEDGEEVTSSAMGITAPIEFHSGNLYLFRSTEALGTGVSVFSRMVKNTYNKVIAYSYTYDGQGRIATATADYDPQLVYTYTYDDEGNVTIKDKDSGTVQELPATRLVTESFYEPLFRTSDSSMPKSGYYIFLCTSDMDVVISGRTTDITGKDVLAVRWGVLASIATNFVGAPGQKVIAQAFAELYAELRALGSVVDNMGYLRARRLTLDNFPEICGTPMCSAGEGAPSAPPEVPFQEYYDSSNNKFYKAKGVLPDTPSTADWVAIN